MQETGMLLFYFSTNASNWGLSNCLTEQISMFLGGYSSVAPFGRATFPHKGRFIRYVLRRPKNL